MKRGEPSSSRAWTGRLLRRFILPQLLTCLLGNVPTAAAGPPQAKSGLPLLTRAQQIRNLKPEEANRGYPVRIRGVVTFYFVYDDTPGGADLFIQDSTAGVWIDIGSSRPKLHPGQSVEVEGFSAAPDFAPQITNPRFRVLGRAPLPAARRVSFNRMVSTKEDSQWVEAEGIVHAARNDGGLLRLDLAVDAGRVQVQVPNSGKPVPASLLDAKVRIHGACGAVFNQKNQITGVILDVPGLEQIHILEPAVTDPFLLPWTPISSLLRFNPLGFSGHRVKVRGTVTLQKPGKSLFIKNGNYGLAVQTPQAGPVQPGDVVEVLGFPAIGEYSAVLEDATFRRISAGPLAIPNPIRVGQALDGSHDADFVSVQARLLEGTLGAGPHVLSMEADKTVFRAEMADAQPRHGLDTLAPGSLLKLTGICVVQADENHNPQGFRILIQSVEGVELVETPPWGSAEHLKKIIFVMAAIVLGSLVLTTILKRQVNEKTETIREGLKRETASRERYQELFENASDMVFTCDLEGRFISMNKAGRQMLGLANGAPLDGGLAQILASGDPALARKILEETSEQGQGTFEVELAAKSKLRIELELGTRLIRRQGWPPEVQGIGRDITHRRKLEEQLRQAQKMEAVGRLAGGVAHDFNNLLTVISGFGQLVLGRMDPADPKCQQMTEILGAADRAAGLTSQLLAFSRQQVLRPELLDLNVALANIAGMLRRVIGEDIELVILPGQDLGRVIADSGEIDRAILNLAVNARDAMPQGGKLILQTENVRFDKSLGRAHDSLAPGDYILVSVCDTGCGMDRETRKHLFEPFFTTKEPGKGTGLGLAAVHGIVSQSGGHISVYTELGKGTCFKIYLPRVDLLTKPGQGGEAEEQASKGSGTILLVEDEALVRNLTVEVLRGYGYSVIPAGKPEEALKSCLENSKPIDLLLTDVVMPGMSGLDLAARLKPTHPKMKVLYVSGYAAAALGRQDLAESHAAFLQKPYAPATLVRKVQDVLFPLGAEQTS